MRIVFMGTPDFAVPILERLAGHYPVVGVVTQPDRRAGRGKVLSAPPVRVAAERLGLPFIQPGRLREPEAMAQLTAWTPELVVVAAFGQILRAAVLDLPHHGCLNVHASLLPRHRGAAPIAAAILAGDLQTGITIMKMDVGLDTGPMLSQRAIPILPTDTSGSLAGRLAQVGAELLLETLPRYLAGGVHAQAQDDQLATYAPQLKKEDGRLEFERPAEQLERAIRAYTPWPGAFGMWRDQPLRLWRVEVVPGSWPPGLVVEDGEHPVVGCGSGGLRLGQVQPPGKRVMDARDFARGARDFIGATLT
jgi:methionyl-tRNA formyltransferase